MTLLTKQPNSEMCFVCGRSNPVGLYMQFHDDGDTEVTSEYTVPEQLLAKTNPKLLNWKID